LDLKTKIKNQKGFEVDSQKIVFKGKSTTNTDDLEKLGVKEGDFLVVMTVVKVIFFYQYTETITSKKSIRKSHIN
jgi:hypothetical protein